MTAAERMRKLMDELSAKINYGDKPNLETLEDNNSPFGSPVGQPVARPFKAINRKTLSESKS